MGQEIAVVTRPGSSPSVRIFGCNRSLTGMAIERYAGLDDARGARPPDVLARRLLELGATRVTVYSSDVIVEAPLARWVELEAKVVAVIEHLFGFYGDDAGWSDERLRAMGIEPLPRPEPAK
jgi:hypothetical protein